MASWLEKFWGELLSRDAARALAAFKTLKDPKEREAIVSHLQAMASEAGWTEPQRISAKHALDAIQPLIDNTDN